MIEATKLLNRIGIAGALALLAAGPVVGQSSVASDDEAFQIPDNIVILGPTEATRKATAIVNGTVITGTDIDQRVALLIAASDQGPPPPEEMERLRLEVLRTLIDETLQIEEAKALEIQVPSEDIERAYQRLASQRFNRTPQEMDAWLTQLGSSPQSLRRQIEGELAWDRLLRRNVAPFVNVSASEVTELYDRLQASRGSTEYRLAEIFLPATPATRDTVAANAQRILEQIQQGASFAAVARQYSQASTAAVGGDLGWIKLAQLQNPQLEAVARDLQPSQLVGPIEIPGGFEILLLIDRRTVGMADPRDAILSLKQISLDFAPGTPEAEARAKATGFQQATAQINGCGDADVAARRLGAEVVTNDQIRLRDLPEPLQPLLLQLNIGQATPPFGSLEEGVRVLMLCGRDDPAAATGPSYDQLMAQLQDDRIGKRAQRYLRDLRRDAVIEYN